ncbi:hypothetical protein TrVFT333_008675 [Trichoderma virens FT-333]|nr:hypothetical protein TrVFT333_008675 [Trichoderma virens FT-333]
MAAPKIIVLGSLNGQLDPALKKLATLHAKNQFSLAILTGDIPLPTYFTVGMHPLPPRIAAKVEADEEICPNLHYLGKRSVTKTSEGIRIVTLGGVLDTNLVAGQSQEQHLPFHTAGDAKALRGANSTDILLTSMWPAKVWTGSKVVLEPSQQAAVSSSDEIADLCAALKPRYHISASPEAFFYEREPFVQQSDKDPNTIVATRFISMAPYGNDKKQKAIVEDRMKGTAALGITMMAIMADTNVGVRHPASIGDEAYVTTAKGPLPTSSTFADQGLDFPGHFIIIPLPHSPTISSMGSVADPTSEAVKAYKEMTRFKESLQAMIASKSSHKLGVVTYEISRDRNVHLIWQLVAVPAEIIQKGLAEAAFRVEAENLKYPGFTTKDLPLEDLASSGDFFRVWLWADNGEDKIKGKSLVMPLASDARFDLQFGRRSVEEETKDVEAFREAFKDWDFTL